MVVATTWALGLAWWTGVVVAGAAMSVPLKIVREKLALSVPLASSSGSMVRTLAAICVLLASGGLAVVQFRFAKEDGLPDWRRWWQGETPAQGTMPLLRSAMDWVHQNLPREAVLIGNASMLSNLTSSPPAIIDSLTVDKYYFYSAFSSRRQWLEGPTYLRDQLETKRRMKMAEDLFSRGAIVIDEDWGEEKFFALFDRELPAVAMRPSELGEVVFENSRFTIVRVEQLRSGKTSEAVLPPVMNGN